ncbi:hypothetical protein KBC75_03055 [Candidatus Shapirobacteria bacterium]|nr:hypothetical protein [Candidatus Shapirobacteria bacterium]
MVLFVDKYLVDSSRLAGWNYSSKGIYFVTFCTYRHNKHFGEIVEGKMKLNQMGAIVDEEIKRVFSSRINFKLHKYVVMPNHVHILFEILFSVETPQRDVSNINIIDNFRRPEIATHKWQSNSVGSIINQIKSISTKRINKIPKMFGWQPRFYDEVIRSNNEFWSRYKYIENNPKNWGKDQYNELVETLQRNVSKEYTDLS